MSAGFQQTSTPPTPTAPLLSNEMKSPTAFRTISEVADDLALPQHVLRFWESKFQQIKPLKRGGGRRYYRPEDVRIIHDIKDLLYNQGFTIRGVQKLWRNPNCRPACSPFCNRRRRQWQHLKQFSQRRNRQYSNPPAYLPISGEKLRVC
jgi:DNA-binding transcriptional MerR regulator